MSTDASVTPSIVEGSHIRSSHTFCEMSRQARHDNSSSIINKSALISFNLCHLRFIPINYHLQTMGSSYNESEVLALLQDENTQRKGFEMVVAQYSEQLYWQIRRMVFSHDDANDAKLSTWLYRIALNECLTFLNKQRAAATVSLDDPEADVLQRLEGDAYFSGDKAQMLLQKALLTLPEKQRMVFNLKYFQEMKYEEMSEIFGTSVGALKASYHHAIKKIEKFLEEGL